MKRTPDEASASRAGVRATRSIKCAAKAGVYVEIAGRRLGAGQTGPEWQQFTMEFTTGENVLSGGWVGCSLINSSDQPAYFDDLTIEEIQ